MKAKFLSIALSAILMLSIMAFWNFSTVEATIDNQPIILPFWTGWDGTNPVGRTNVVECAKDFYGYYGPSNPLPPELGVREEEAAAPIPAPGTFFGYNFLTHYLMAAGYFGSSDSHCYFRLFDATADSDYQTSFKLKPHTYLDIWYYHYKLGDCMIDAEVFNAYDRTFFRLSNFSYNGKYVVDQNRVRIHPAYRYNDPIGSWEFASFDLSIVYQSAPGYMYVTKILVGFDNSVDHATGQARTYFDLLHISYGVGWSYTARNPYDGAKDTCSASIIAWESGLDITGYTLTLKVTVSGYTDLLVTDYTPMYLNVEVRDIPNLPHHPANVEASPEPIGINLEQKNNSLTRVWEYAMDCASAIIGYLPYGYLLTVYELASGFYGLLTETGGATYQWPKALTFGQTHPQWIMGEAYIRVHELSEGGNLIDVLCYTDYYYWFFDRWWYFWRTPVEFYFEWINEPEELPIRLKISTTAGGTTDPPPGSVVFTYGSSVTVTASAYSGYTFNYWLLDGATKYSNPITVTMDSDHTLSAYFVKLANLVVKVPQAPPEGVKVWVDGTTYKAYASSPVSVTVKAGQHTIEAERSFLKEGGTPGTYFFYFFDCWSDGSKDNPRTMPITSGTTLTAYYIRSEYGWNSEQPEQPE